MFKIKSNAVVPSVGKVLVSEPLLQGFYFRRSAVLLIDHGKDGSFGVILNKPLITHVKEIIPELSDFEANLHIGGPVEPKCIFFLHKHSFVEGSIHIANGIYWGGNIENIILNINKGNITPKTIRFFVGYSGWNANQIEKELAENTWAVSETNLNETFNLNPYEIWSNLVINLGDDYKFWEYLPTNPQLN